MLIKAIRLYANRCPHCGKLMRLYSWTNSPVKVPTLTRVRLCPERHYLATEHIASGVRQEWYEQGRPLDILSTIEAFPDLAAEEKRIHHNLNVAGRSKSHAKATVAAAASTTAATTAPPVAVTDKP
ncbi:MAG: hypothetical protein HY692_08670 [Cyanobacteria bacterium NC_groundwater_1444_Ag_S-0.65um_54_12]|nr:hypothetical protein [Cyanobacteria bacterium NC_groundwater_1444_Ag_S-0.65um_54_12]